MKKINIKLTNEVVKDWDIFICNKDHGEIASMSSNIDWFFWEDISKIFPLYTSKESQKLIFAYSQKYKLPLRGCILYAHGSSGDNGDWTYLDEDTNNEKYISSFLEENDGKYSVIILCVCNDGLVLPKTTSSCVIFGDGMVGQKGVHKHSENMYRALPVFEQVTSYTLEYDTKELLR